MSSLDEININMARSAAYAIQFVTRFFKRGYLGFSSEIWLYKQV